MIVAVIFELYLDYEYFSGPHKCCRKTTTDPCTVFVRSVTREVPSHLGRTPEYAGTVHQ